MSKKDTNVVYQWLKWRWEFMRRNKDYKKDFVEVEKNWIKYKWNPFPINPIFLTSFENYWFFETEDSSKPQVSRIEMNPSYLKSIEFEVEKEFCRKWDLKTAPMIDPDQSFDELYYEPLKYPDPLEDSDSLLKWGKFEHLCSSLRSDAIQTIGLGILETNNGKNTTSGIERNIKPIGQHLLIDIDFEKVNSVGSLKAVVSNTIDHYIKTHGQENGINYRGKKNLIDYDLILLAGDMRKNNKVEKIARKLFPNNFKGYKQESAIRKVHQYVAKYNELVGGGYKKLIFP
jgi:hypothetical protein